MDLIRSTRNSVYVGGLERAVQKPEKEMWIRAEAPKGAWQDVWEPELRDCRASRPRKGDIWGAGKDGEEATAAQISANPVTPSAVRQRGCNENLKQDRQTGSAWKMEGRSKEFSLNRKNRKRTVKKPPRDIQVHPIPMAELAVL